MVRCVTTEKLFYDAYSYTFGHTDRKSALEVLPHRQKKKFSSSFTTFLTMKRKIRVNFSYEIFPHSTVLENNSKCLIQNCERSELRLHIKWTNVKQCCQTGKLF